MSEVRTLIISLPEMPDGVVRFTRRNWPEPGKSDSPLAIAICTILCAQKPEPARKYGRMTNTVFPRN